MSHLDATIIRLLSILSVGAVGVPLYGQTEARAVTERQTLPIIGWYSSGSLKITENADRQEIEVNGRGSGTWSITGERLPFDGKALALRVEGSAGCNFKLARMLKLEANGVGVRPVEPWRRNLGDPEFVSAGDGKVSFRLPARVTKLAISFWNADLKGLRISGVLSVKPESLALPVVQGKSRGKLEATPDRQANSVVLNGEVKEARYVIEGELGMGGRTLILLVSGSNNCVFEHGKMFELRADDRTVPPLDNSRESKTEPGWVAPGDGIVRLRLPEAPRKVEFVFSNAKLKGLVICEAQAFPILGWSAWGGINVDQRGNDQSIQLDGNVDGAAGYSVEGKLPMGGKILSLAVTGSKRCTFTHSRMLKLEANGKALPPLERTRQNLGDPDFVNAGDGIVSFRLPEALTKLDIVFWKAKLKGLVIRGVIRPNREGTAYSE